MRALLLIGLALSLAACGGDDGDDARSVTVGDGPDARADVAGPGE